MSEESFESAIREIRAVQRANTDLVQKLQLENAQLVEKIALLEQLSSVEAKRAKIAPAAEAAASMPTTRKTKRGGLGRTSTTQRLACMDVDDEVVDEGGDTASHMQQQQQQSQQVEDDATPNNSKKAAFKLIAHSGDDREEICPKSRDITLPVLVKSYVEFVWKTAPQCALVMLRPGDSNSFEAFKEVCMFLFARNIRVLVEPSVDVDAADERIQKVDHDALQHCEIDFIVTLGGDGTFIHAAEAFPRACPPILAFAFGSLGFLTPFPAITMLDSLRYVMEEEVGLRLRARLEVEVKRAGHIPFVAQVLNECVIDRGTSSSLVKLMLYSNRDGTQPVTVVQGDGLILASPTGSTAYSLSAGGSMVHPSVPAILVTPICPHSLSFRPILVPDSATLRVQVALDARNPAYLSLDGKPGVEMKQGDEFTIRYSSFPVPAIMSKRTSMGDSDGWLSSLRTALNWNATQTSQKPLTTGRQE